jgi:isoquinoline 1-oxidoreductase subunit beta
MAIRRGETEATGPVERGSDAQTGSVSRRCFLVCAMAAPTLTIVGRWLLDARDAGAWVSGLAKPAFNDHYDQTDAFRDSSAPTMSKLSLEITEDNRARFSLPRMELGQGITTGIAMIIAEELEFPLDRVEVTLTEARPDLVWNQMTAGSSGTRCFYKPLSEMAAAARERTRHAAAQQWGVPLESVTASDGHVHSTDGRSATFGSLTRAAAAVTGPVEAKPKPVSAHKLLGTRQSRIDALQIVTGQKQFTSDVPVPEAVPAVAVHAPTLGGTLRSIDNERELRAMPGVVDVIPVRAVPRVAERETPSPGPTTIVILAKTMGQALRAEQAVKASWTPGPVDHMSDADFRNALRQQSAPLALPRSGESTVDGEFEFAHLAHASMETNSAVADVKASSAEVWSGLQVPIPAKRDVADLLGLPLGAVTVHVVPSGGGFGGRGYHDVVLEAVLASKAAGRPVKLQWSRIQDIKHDRFRPPTYHRIRAAHDGRSVTSFEHQFTSGLTSHSYAFGDMLSSVGAYDPNSNAVFAQAFFNLMMPAPYKLGDVAQTLDEVDFKMGRNSGAWRAIYTGTARTVEEIMMDEIAAALGKDPTAFRLETLKHDRAKRCLQWVADRGGWGRSMPKGTAQGIGVNTEHHSAVACLVELDARSPAPRVTKAVMAFDAGLPINPSGIENQMLGGLNDAISTIFLAGIHIDNGAVRESSPADFLLARQFHWPSDVTLHVFPAQEGAEPGGAGETTLPAAAGAVANAYARATGTKPRSFPMDPFDPTSGR